MADGDEEPMMGVAKNGGGMWFRIDVPSPGMQSVAHFGKPGPKRDQGYGYPGISFWTTSDVTTKANQKIFFDAGGEFIAVAGEGLALISRSMVNLVGTVAVNIETPGTLWLSAIKRAKTVKYQTLESGGDGVPTDKGRAEFTTLRNMVFEEIKTSQNWAAVIDGVIEVGKAVMGFSNKTTLATVVSGLGVASKVAETAAKVVKAYKDSPKAVSAAAKENAAAYGLDESGQEEAAAETEGALADHEAAEKKAEHEKEAKMNSADHATEIVEGTGFKVAKEMGEAGLGMAEGHGAFAKAAHAAEKMEIMKVLSAVESLAKLYKAGKEIFGEKEASDDSGSINFVAENSLTTAIAKKQTTIAGEGIEIWVPSVKDSYQVVAGGGISMKSGLKTEVFSIQAVSMEGLLGATLASAGPVQVMSRMKTTDVLGKEVKIGANAANIPKSSKEIVSVLQKGWNPMRQKPTDKIQVEVIEEGIILIHVNDEKRQILMNKDKIYVHFGESGSSIMMDKQGIRVETNKTLKFIAEEIVTDAKKTIKTEAKTSISHKVGGSTMEMSKMSITTKSGGNQAQVGSGTTQLK